MRQSGELTIRCGKGNKARAVYLPAGAQVALQKWLELRAQWVENEAHAPLFLPVLKWSGALGGRVVVRRLTDQSVMDILLRRARSGGTSKNQSARFAAHLHFRFARCRGRHRHGAENGRTCQCVRRRRVMTGAAKSPNSAPRVCCTSRFDNSRRKRLK